MTLQLQQFHTEGQVNPEECRNVGLLTISSKLVMALAMALIMTLAIALAMGVSIIISGMS